MLNYRIDPALVQPLVPRGTELDRWRGHAYVSLVGFLFRDTRLLGAPIPLHRHFEELNLRFYVTRRAGDETRRGVTFVKELVPRAAIAIVARAAYNEPYLAVPMSHVVRHEGAAAPSAEYRWRYGGAWSTLSLTATGDPREAEQGSEEAFITEHYWGYTRQRDGGTVEYSVTHPRWRIWRAEAASVVGDLDGLYGPAFASVLAQPPHSAFLADGSPVVVYMPTRVEA